MITNRRRRRFRNIGDRGRLLRDRGLAEALVSSSRPLDREARVLHLAAATPGTDDPVGDLLAECAKDAEKISYRRSWYSSVATKVASF